MTKNRVLKHLARYRWLRTDVKESATVSAVRSNLVQGYEPCWKRAALCRRSLWTCHLSNFTDYLRIAVNWELQCEFANSAWRPPRPLSTPPPPPPLFCLMEEKHTDLQKFTQTTGSSSSESPRSLSVSHRDIWIQTLQQFGTESGNIFLHYSTKKKNGRGGWEMWLWGIFQAHRVIYWLVSCATWKDTRLLMSFSCFGFHDLWTGISRVHFGLLVAIKHICFHSYIQIYIYTHNFFFFYVFLNRNSFFPLLFSAEWLISLVYPLHFRKKWNIAGVIFAGGGGGSVFDRDSIAA